MTDSWHIDNRLPRLRRLITGAVAADIATNLSVHNKKRDDFTAGQLLLLAEDVETTWFKMAAGIKIYADQSKLFKSTMYKMKLGTFLKQHAPQTSKSDNGKMNKLETDIDEIKKQLMTLAGQKRKHTEISDDNKNSITS